MSNEPNEQKGKPSVPVIPISMTNSNNNNNNNDFHVKDSVSSIQNEAPNTLFLNDCQRNDNDDVDQADNKEQRSSVSEIVNKLNSLSCKDSWEKTKRRPVFPSNEMEKELQKSTNEHFPNFQSDLDNFDENNKNDTPDRSLNCNQQQDSVDNAKTINEDGFTKDTASSMSESLNRKETKLPCKRIKGSLKNKDKVNNKINLGRRVSFDPLALLLDASLEGELELVKKTAKQVPNPSSSNDEGITALHNATCAGHFDIVKYLVEIGCDVNVQDSDGWTPLHCAASCNNLTMIKFLVKSGACIFATTFSDHETAAEKCEEDEEGFDGCSQYLYGIQEKLGILNNGVVYALYDYESQNEDELSFKEGDVIKVLQKGDEREKEWWWSKIGNKEGYVPRNLIGLYARIKPKDQNTK